MHASALMAAEMFRDKYLDLHASIADIGSMDVNGSMKSLFRGVYRGFDIAAGRNVDAVMALPDIIPADSNSFDAVVSANCIEHARQPWTLVKEMGRIVKPGGFVFVLAPMPNAHRYHAHPIDCWRCYTEGMRGLFDFAQLKTLELYEAADHDTVGIAQK